MNADMGKERLWPTRRQAFKFLLYAGLLFVPAVCPFGHQWKFQGESDGQGKLHCQVPKNRTYFEFGDSEELEQKVQRGCCNQKHAWRIPNTLPWELPCNMKTDEYLKSLYWSTQNVSSATAARNAGVKLRTYNELQTMLRHIYHWDVMQGWQDEGQLGGPGRVVCVDETYWTRKKHQKSGFMGRRTAGNKTIMIGMLELDLETRMATGRVRFPNQV